MIKIWSIARNTFIQSIRQPVFGLVALSIIPVIILTLPLCICRSMNIHFQESDQRMMANLALSSMQIISFFLAVICASTAINKEIKDKTALMVISKPTARWQFVAGKYLGITMAVSLGFFIGVPVLLMAARHQVTSSYAIPIDWPVIVIGILGLALGVAAAGFGNYFFNWNFFSASIIALAVTLSASMVVIGFVSRDWGAAQISDTFAKDRINMQLVTGMVMVYLSVILLTAFAVAASTRLGQLQTFLACAVFMALGAMHEWTMGYINSRLPGAGAAIIDAIMPNFNIYEPYDALAKERDITTGVVGYIGLYTVFYSTALVLAGIALFQGRELMAESSAATPPGPVGLACALWRFTAAGLIVAVIATINRGKEFTFGAALAAAVMFICAAAAWILSIAIGKAAKWAWWISIVIAGLVIARTGAVMILPRHTAFLQIAGMEEAITALSAVAGTLLAILLVLPKTRHYFKSVSSLSPAQG
jgi:ABC-type transport system involved in multi-copper enzyme maturation permease subunit